jgi:hypothetical protein
MHTRRSSGGSGATTPQTTGIGRALLGRCVEAPLKGTHMIMTEAYRRILARAAHGQLPPWVIEESEPDFRCIRELYEEKCLVGLHVASPTMEGPTSTCASARKAGRCTTGYGRPSRATNLVSECMLVFARKAGLSLTDTHGPQGRVQPCSARQPALPWAPVNGEAGS